jgi:hypothetical protein
MVVRKVQWKNAKAEINTYGGHVWMIDPGLEDERTNTNYNGNHIIVLFCHGISVYVDSKVPQ